MQIVMTGFAGDAGSMKLATENAELMTGRFAPSFIRRFDEIADSCSQGGGECSLLAEEEVCVPISDGVYAALWGLGEYYGCGLEVYQEDIPIKQETIEVCEVLDINPYELASSGCIYMIPDGEMPAEGQVIGRSRSDNDRVVIRKCQRGRFYLTPKSCQTEPSP